VIALFEPAFSKQSASTRELLVHDNNNWVITPRLQHPGKSDDAEEQE
jgi:hypothetical protein